VAGYSGTPLARKLGVTPGATVLLDGAPDTFSLDAEQASVTRRLGAGPYDVIVCFCTTRERLAARWASLHPRTTPAGALWIAWPKRASGVPTDLNENVVREFALTLDAPVPAVIERCVAEGVNPGYALGGDYPEHEDGLLVALTEKRTRADIDRLAEVLGGAVAAERTRDADHAGVR